MEMLRSRLQVRGVNEPRVQDVEIIIYMSSKITKIEVKSCFWKESDNKLRVEVFEN